MALNELLTKHTTAQPNRRVHINNVKFSAKPGYYYSKVPVANLNFPGGENYIVTTVSKLTNDNNHVVEVEFKIEYNTTEFDVFSEDGHNVSFISDTTKEVNQLIETKEIRALNIDKSVIRSNGEFRNISVAGTPGSIFSLTIKDKNGVNILSHSNKITKSITTAATTSNILNLNNAEDLEVGMVVLNNQRRNVKITSITDTVKSNVDAVNETSSINITVSSHLTFSAGESITFAKEGELTKVVIPENGTYSFVQNFPALEKFTRTLKTAASSAKSLTLDYTKDLEDDMKITGTGVDGNDPVISSNGVDPDGVTITVSDSQTIADETRLTFEMPDNRYDITLYPINAILGNDVPRYSSDDCDILPTYSIHQYIDPVVQFVPSTDISNVTVSGAVSYRGNVYKNTYGSASDISTNIVISMTATKSDGNLVSSRNPRFSTVDPDSSDFSNTLNTFVKTVREGDCVSRDIVHLNNTTGIRVGMIVTKVNIEQPQAYQTSNDFTSSKTITVKSITGTSVMLSSKLSVDKDSELAFTSMYVFNISGLTSTLSANGGHATGICTVEGRGAITTFGIDSFTSTFNFDNFLSAVE